MAMKYLETMMTESVRRAQQQYYGLAAKITDTPERDPLGDSEVEFIAARESFYLGTTSETGWPYIQHRGGPRGFLQLINPTTLIFADYQGNRQLLSTGNLAVNDRVSLFLMDYPNRTRLKILGHARVEDAKLHPNLAAQLTSPSMRARVERIVFIEVVSFDWNCPKYITTVFAGRSRGTRGTIEIPYCSVRSRVESRKGRVKTIANLTPPERGKGDILNFPSYRRSMTPLCFSHDGCISAFVSRFRVLARLEWN